MKKLSNIFFSGLCGVTIGVLIFIILFTFPNLFHDSKEMLMLFFTLLYVAMLGLGMRGTPASTDEFVTTFIFVILLTVLMYFIAGNLIYLFYTKVIKPKGKLVASIFFILIIILITSFTFYQSKVSYNNETVSSCQGFNISKLKKHFDTRDCLYNVSRMTDDPLACEQIPENDHRKSNCVMNIAEKKIDYKICDLLSDTVDKKNCLSGVALIKGECSVLNPTSADYCYLYNSESIRVHARDNRCDVFRTDQNEQSCEKFKNGTITIQDLCKNITDTTLKDQCLYRSINGIRVRYGD